MQRDKEEISPLDADDVNAETREQEPTALLAEEEDDETVINTSTSLLLSPSPFMALTSGTPHRSAT
jgi:hypothetical protein